MVADMSLIDKLEGEMPGGCPKTVAAGLDEEVGGIQGAILWWDLACQACQGKRSSASPCRRVSLRKVEIDAVLTGSETKSPSAGTLGCRGGDGLFSRAVVRVGQTSLGLGASVWC